MKTRVLVALLSTFVLIACGGDGDTPPGNTDATIGSDSVDTPDTVGPDVPQCTAQCDGKQCGDDGCGGSCGTCVGGNTCSVTGICEQACVADCAGKTCGGDGCGSFCGSCEPGQSCNAAGTCEASCVADCAGKICGSDGCGSFCGSCDPGQSCNAAGTCEASCVGDCAGKICGGDGCGGSCGECVQDETCNNGACEAPVPCGDVSFQGCCDELTLQYCNGGSLVLEDCAEAGTCGWEADNNWYGCGGVGVDPSGENAIECGGSPCEPSCVNKFCGGDGCGGSCGECAEGETCSDNFLCTTEPCLTACDDKECGADGCGGVCGDCGFGAWCDADGQCNDCIAECGDKVCGADGCGGSCGTCADGFSCNEGGQCMEGGCVADCTDKVCGSDGCGGECGAGCEEGLVCSEGQCIEGGSCEGLCGIYDFTAPCQCDDYCFGLGDCCADVCTACLADFADFCCEPSCEDKQCGDDECGGTCGEGCLEGSYCDDAFQCVEEVCEPQCENKTCGDDGCDGTCAPGCEEGQSCNADGACVEAGPGMVGTQLETLTFEQEQAPYFNCEITVDLVSVGDALIPCDACDYAWEVLATPAETDCGEWIGELNDGSMQLGISLETKTLFIYSEEGGEWVATDFTGTINGNMYLGSFFTGMIYYLDMNESGVYDEGEGLSLGYQIGFTWAE